MKYHEHLSLEDLWTRILLGLDVMHDAVQRDITALSATNLNVLLRALSALRQEGPLAPTSVDHIGSALGILEEAVARKTMGHRNVFDGVHDPEDGAVGRVRSVPILSEAGTELDAHLAYFRRVLAMRDLLAARVDAELQIASLKAA